MAALSVSEESGPDLSPFVRAAVPPARNQCGSQRGTRAALAHPAPSPGPRSLGENGLSSRYSSRDVCRTHRPVRPTDGLNSTARLGRV